MVNQNTLIYCLNLTHIFILFTYSLRDICHLPAWLGRNFSDFHWSFLVTLTVFFFSFQGLHRLFDPKDFFHTKPSALVASFENKIQTFHLLPRLSLQLCFANFNTFPRIQDSVQTLSFSVWCFNDSYLLIYGFNHLPTPLHKLKVKELKIIETDEVTQRMEGTWIRVVEVWEN